MYTNKGAIYCFKKFRDLPETQKCEPEESFFISGMVSERRTEQTKRALRNSVNFNPDK
jgi:hypothetical protein